MDFRHFRSDANASNFQMRISQNKENGLKGAFPHLLHGQIAEVMSIKSNRSSIFTQNRGKITILFSHISYPGMTSKCHPPPHE